MPLDYGPAVFLLHHDLEPSKITRKKESRVYARDSLNIITMIALQHVILLLLESLPLLEPQQEQPLSFPLQERSRR